MSLAATYGVGESLNAISWFVTRVGVAAIQNVQRRLQPRLPHGGRRLEAHLAVVRERAGRVTLADVDGRCRAALDEGQVVGVCGCLGEHGRDDVCSEG